MPHIHNQSGQHDFTVSAFIFKTDGPEPVLLLHKHKILGKLLQIGGHVELAENPWAAMTHEVLEESGYSMDQLKVLQPATWLKTASDAIVHPIPVSMNTHDFKVGHRHIDLEYAFVTNQLPASPVGEGESREFIWVTRKQLTALSDEDIFPNVRDLGEFCFTTVFKNWVPVEARQFKTL